MMNTTRSFQCIALMALFASPLSIGCEDGFKTDPGTTGTVVEAGRPAAGVSGSVAGASGRTGAIGVTPNVRCPDEVPTVGESCQTTEPLCVYKRRGPCPPDADQLRQCINGKWAATAPAIDCRARPIEDDAGQDAG